MAAREIITLGFGSFGSAGFITLFGFGVAESVPLPAAPSTMTDPKVLALTVHSSGQQRVYTPKTRYVTGGAFDEIRE